MHSCAPEFHGRVSIDTIIAFATGYLAQDIKTNSNSQHVSCICKYTYSAYSMLISNKQQHHAYLFTFPLPCLYFSPYLLDWNKKTARAPNLSVDRLAKRIALHLSFPVSVEPTPSIGVRYQTANLDIQTKIPNLPTSSKLVIEHRNSRMQIFPLDAFPSFFPQENPNSTSSALFPRTTFKSP